MRFGGWRLAKAFSESLDGKLGGYFTAVMATDTVGQDKQPAVRASLMRIWRDDLANRVFINLPHNARIGQLSEIDL